MPIGIFFQPYLKNAFAHRARLGYVPESPIDATDCQAIFILTEMEDPTIVRDLLSCLRMSKEDLRLLYGDSLTEHMWLPFAKLGCNYLDELWQFVTDASVDLFARHAAVAGIVAMHHFHPASRAAAVAFIERLLRQNDGGQVSRTECLPDAVSPMRQAGFPIDHLAGFLCDCADSGLTELARRAEQFAATMDDDEETQYPMATADDVRRAFRDGVREDFISGPPHDVYGVNKQWQRWCERQEEAEGEPVIPGWFTEYKELIEKVDKAASSRYEDKRRIGSRSLHD